VSSATCGAISDIGTVCVTGGTDGVCRFFDTQSGKQLRTFKAAEAVTAVALCPHSSYAAAGCADGYVTLFDFRQNEVVAENQMHDGNITSLAFHPTLNYILTGSADKKVLIIKVPRLRILYTLEAHKEMVTGVGWSRAGDRFVSCGGDRGVFVWSSPEGETAEEEEEAADEEESAEEQQKNQEAEDDQIDLEKLKTPTAHGSIVKQVTTSTKKKIQTMRLILDKINDLEEVVSKLEARVKRITGMIEEIEIAKANEKPIAKKASLQ
jgi:WD40 repeat protein